MKILYNKLVFFIRLVMELENYAENHALLSRPKKGAFTL
jgi:hypothetical protein